MIFTMSFNLTWHMSAAKSNLTRLQAGDLGWPHSEDRRFRKTCWRGWQPPRLRFGRKTDELKPENQP
jgi:ribulose bisphosphate carboxylase small subunit